MKMGGANLPYEIEHHFPDYHVYDEYVFDQIQNHGKKRSYFTDYLDCSIGFLTRGCFRKCDFCVNKKYDRVQTHSPLEEFVDNDRKYIYLWDDNFLGCPQWETLLDQLQATGKPFCFRQGLDIRLLTEKKAEKLAKCRYKSDITFAFDSIDDKDLIVNKLKIWKQYSDKQLRFYVLCAFDSQDEHDIANTFERIKILMRFGCIPYIMRYEAYKGSDYERLYTNIARWCNQPSMLKKKSYREYCYLDQKLKNPKGLCSALQSMLDFESKFPDIAGKYFDMRFEDLNMYKKC